MTNDPVLEKEDEITNEREESSNNQTDELSQEFRTAPEKLYETLELQRECLLSWLKKHKVEIWKDRHETGEWMERLKIYLLHEKNSVNDMEKEVQLANKVKTMDMLHWKFK